MGLGDVVCAPDLRVGRPDLTHRFAQPANNEWHSGTVPHATVCAILPATAIYSFIDTFLVFPIHSCFIVGFIPLLFLFVLVYIPSLPFCYAGFARLFSHIGTNRHVFHTSRVYFAANILFSSLASAVKT